MIVDTKLAFSIDDAASYFGVSKHWFRTQARRGLRTFKIGKRTFVTAADVIEYARNRKETENDLRESN